MRFGRGPTPDPFAYLDNFSDTELISALEPALRALNVAVQSLKEVVKANPDFYRILWELAKTNGTKMFIKAAMNGVNFEAIEKEDFVKLFRSPALERLISTVLVCIDSQNEVTNGAA